MPSKLSKPEIKVDVGAVTIEGRSNVGMKLTCVENGFFTATVDFHNPKHDLLTEIVNHAPIVVYLKDRSRSTWETFFDGEIHFLKKNIKTKAGTTFTAKCDGSGFGFAEMLVAQEYGYQSANPNLDLIFDILSDPTAGIVPKWINKILGTATDSGYSYDTTYIDSIPGAVPYLYYPYKPASKSLTDLLDILQALQDPGDPGPHFLVNHDGEVLVTPVGDHSATAAAHGWPTYVGGSVGTATLEQGVDFQDFDFNEETELANYILYHSKLQWPGTADLTETAAIGDYLPNGGTTLSYDTTNKKVGVQSLQLVRNTAFQPLFVRYDAAEDLNLDLTKAGGLYNIPYFAFWIMRTTDLDPTGATLNVSFYKNYQDYYWTSIDFTKLLPNPNEWRLCSMPVGPNWHVPELSGVFPGWIKTIFHSGEFWDQINYMEFSCSADGPITTSIMWLDGIHFEGYVIRAAYNSTLIAANECKMRITNDSFAKGDTLIAVDDSGTIALLAKAELLRQQTTPLVATVNTRLIRKALAGQLVHIHALPDGSGGFNLDKDFRITQIVHNILEKSTNSNFSITDDVTNSISRPAADSMNALTKSYRPEFQDRQSTGTKMRDIDITQAILSVDYG